MTITLYTKPACVQCEFSKRTLKRQESTWEEVDLTQDAQALALVKGEGFLTAPVVRVTDADGNVIDQWGGFRPEKIAQYA